MSDAPENKVKKEELDQEPHDALVKQLVTISQWTQQ